MARNMSVLVRRKLQNVQVAINKIKNLEFISNKKDLNEGQAEFKKIIRRRLITNEQIVVENKDDESQNTVYDVCDEESMIYFNDNAIIANFSIEDEIYCEKALQNLKMQDRVEVLYHTYDMNGKIIPETISLHKLNKEDDIDVLTILNEVDRLKTYGKECCLLDALWYRSFIKNFLKEDELYYRRALQNLNLENEYKILDEAYDVHGRKCPKMLSLHKTESNNTRSVYKIEDEVKRLKSFGIYSRLINEEENMRVALNFSEEDELYYRRTLKMLGVQNDFEIVDDAYDVHGRKIEGMMSLHRIDPSNKFDIRKIYTEVNRMLETMAS